MEEQDFLVRLVKRIEEEPSLYKLEDHNYSNDNVRHQAFLRIKDKLIDDGATEDQASVVTIRDKFRILKRRFSSEHRRKGAKSQWPFYQHLTFLIPCVEHSYEQEAMRNAEKRKDSNGVEGDVDGVDVGYDANETWDEPVRYLSERGNEKLFHHGYLYVRDVGCKDSWRCANKTLRCPGRVRFTARGVTETPHRPDELPDIGRAITEIKYREYLELASQSREPHKDLYLKFVAKLDPATRRTFPSLEKSRTTVHKMRNRLNKGIRPRSFEAETLQSSSGNASKSVVEDGGAEDSNRFWSMASSTPRGSPEDNDGEGSVVSVKETLEQSLNLPRSVTRRGVNPFNKDEEKVLFNADLQTWLRTHTCCGVKTKPVYDQIIEAIQMKEQGIVFPAHLERDYVIYAEKYELVKDEVENYVVYRKGKKVVHEAELFDILYDLHQKTAHSRRDVMFKKLNEKYDGISKNLVIMFLKTCRYCELNGIGIPRERSSTQSKRNGSSSPQNNFLMEIMRGADENQLGEGADEDEDYGPSTNSNPLSMFLKACDQNLMSYCDSPKTDSNVSMDEKNDFGEVMALAAYQLRQTYLLLRVVNDPSHLVVCKVNDEDYFPSGKVDHTVADRANWSPGQIVRAYFGFEQRPKDCVVESVGASEAVQDEFFKAKLKLTNQPQNPQRSQENGAPEPKKARTEPAVTARNGSLQSSDMRNIQNRFEEMEERLRFLEQQVFTNTSIPKLDFMGTGA
ncbi:unnamed protein product [Bursaphelenchus xylophilus]|uniref:(pine wood nematode) hypothetical protein n=1 Tax=Bursaphelenchus xylophilus TaxID=6326 RepID=A0A1I7S711_BURXY|nr:unnamed protein product [Bursaphelenchus xylophilus]CAG9079449.1 unnamed protein product [Bursaphelenchus xylophilus]